MHLQHQKGILPNIPKDPIDDHEINTVRKREKSETKIYTLSFPFWPTATAKKPMPTFCYCKLPQFTFCHCKPMHYLQNFHLNISKYRQIQTWDTSKIYSNN